MGRRRLKGEASALQGWGVVVLSVGRGRSSGGASASRRLVPQRWGVVASAVGRRRFSAGAVSGGEGRRRRSVEALLPQRWGVGAASSC